MSQDSEGEQLTHTDSAGAAHMVDVTGKSVSIREASAAGKVWMQPETARLIRQNVAAKGDVLAVARIAGIMAAKRTSDLIPLCHGLPLTGIEVSFDVQDDGVAVRASARLEGKTGVEMEALTAVSVAALTIYDMCKAVDRRMTICDIRMTYKSGGRSGTFIAD